MSDFYTISSSSSFLEGEEVTAYPSRPTRPMPGNWDPHDFRPACLEDLVSWTESSVSYPRNYLTEAAAREFNNAMCNTINWLIDHAPYPTSPSTRYYLRSSGIPIGYTEHPDQLRHRAKSLGASLVHRQDGYALMRGLANMRVEFMWCPCHEDPITSYLSVYDDPEDVLVLRPTSQDEVIRLGAALPRMRDLPVEMIGLCPEHVPFRCLMCHQPYLLENLPLDSVQRWGIDKCSSCAGMSLMRIRQRDRRPNDLRTLAKTWRRKA